MSCSITQIEKGVEGLYFKTERFSTTLLSFHFYMPLAKDTAAGYALLPFLLTTCSKKYPDFSRLNYKLSKLYGASLEASAEKVGDLQSLKIAVSVIDDKYALDNEPLCAQACELLLRLIFEPKTEENAFAEEDVEREKRKAIEHIRGELADKRIYARRRMTEEMFASSSYGTPKCGTEQQVEQLTGAQLYQMWKTLLQKAAVRINVVSSALPSSLFDTIGARFAEIGREDFTDCRLHTPAEKVDTPQTITERMDLTQGKLCLGFSSELSGTDEDTAALFVFSDIFGGGPYSKLFSNVREKMSLCYYCSASSNRLKGLIMVDSGVEAQNADTALEAILSQLQAIQNGDISDFEFASSLRSLSDALRTVCDSPSGIDDWYANKIANRTLISPADFAEKINCVTREEVIAAAQGVCLNTVYRLLPKEK